MTRCNGHLRVDENQNDGQLDVGNNLILHSTANGARVWASSVLGQVNVLLLNTDPHHGDVIISHPDDEPEVRDANVEIQSPRLRIGSPGQAGHIDANGQNVLLLGQALNIGTTLRTRGIVLGRIDAGDANVNVTVNSPLLVNNGVGIAGRLDAALDGAATRNLGIGTQNTTADVVLGRQGQTVHLAAPLNVGANPIQLVVAGITFRIVGNAQGHGWGASADFMVGDNVVGWWDTAGIHVQPPVPPV